MICQKYHLLALKPSRGLLTFVDRTGTSRYMVFAKRDHAHACKQFMSEYLDTYERWPHVDFSVGDLRFLSDDRIDQDIVVHTLSERGLDFIAMYSASAMLHVDEFEYIDKGDDSITGTIRFDGWEADPVINKHMFAIQLEASLKLG